MISFKPFSTAFVLFVLLFSPGSAMAQAEPPQGLNQMNAPEESNSGDEPLTKIATQGTHIYLLCIHGTRKPKVIIRSCNLKEAVLREAYERPDSKPKMKVIRIDNPSKEQLKNIRSNMGNKIAVVHVVAHSTLDEQKPDGIDVWDCKMSPTDFSDIFPGSWVIWSGCLSRTICELADNILPSQCEIAWLHSDDEEWKKLYECLESLGGTPADRNEICLKVWGKKWAKDAEPPSEPMPGTGPGQ